VKKSQIESNASSHQETKVKLWEGDDDDDDDGSRMGEDGYSNTDSSGGEIGERYGEISIAWTTPLLWNFTADIISFMLTVVSWLASACLDWQETTILDLSDHSLSCLFIRYQTYEHDILKTNELNLL